MHVESYCHLANNACSRCTSAVIENIISDVSVGYCLKNALCVTGQWRIDMTIARSKCTLFSHVTLNAIPHLLMTVFIYSGSISESQRDTENIIFRLAVCHTLSITRTCIPVSALMCQILHFDLNMFVHNHNSTSTKASAIWQS